MSLPTAPETRDFTVSIIVPAYNEEKYIRTTLQSLTELQKIATVPVEIIVCDNGSTDNTTAIIAEFPNVILTHENNLRGANAARQGAFKQSTGTIIAAVDADCIPDHQWVTNALHYFTNPQVISVAGIYVYENTFWLAPVINWLQTSLVYVFHFVAHNIFHGGGVMIGGNAWYRREALEKIGGFETSIPFWGDDAHTAKMLAPHGKMIYTPNVRVLSSSRRFTINGPLKTQMHYLLNYLWITVTGKPYTKSIDDDVVR
jgi:cellulose synthase/poly-beta-1,6-N-acetylglucosamine synthase-like glycosyltransferase